MDPAQEISNLFNKSLFPVVDTTNIKTNDDIKR